MYPGIELRLYRYVSVLAEELNFTQAASRLNVSQPTLSTQIRDLEREIGTKLFERTRGGQQILLTAAGQAFAAQARLTLLHADRAVQEARVAAGTEVGVWKFGYSPLIDLRLVSKVRACLSDLHPASEIQFISGHTSEVVHGLQHGHLHAGLAIVSPREKRVQHESVHEDRLLLALPNQHPLALKKEVGVRDLHELPLVKLRGDIEPTFGDWFKLLFDLIRIRPRVLYETTNQVEALELTVQNDLAAITTPSAQRAAMDGIVFRKFVEEILFFRTSLVYYGEPISPILKSLRTFLADTFQPFGSW